MCDSWTGGEHFANVSYLMPAVTGSFAISRTPIRGHSRGVVDMARSERSEYGLAQLIKVSRAMALTALDLFTDPALLAEARAGHAHRVRALRIGPLTWLVAPAIWIA